MAANSPNIFVTKFNLELTAKLKSDLTAQGFEFSTPPYTIFSAKKKGISCTLYQSGKLTVQGKEMGHFLEFYLEPEILGSFAYTYKEESADSVDATPHIGVDESGKGDFFGPLCIAAVYADNEGIKRLLKLGVKDSKVLSEKTILKIAREIREQFLCHIVRINPLKYNELYTKFGNLNHLLAWGACHHH